MSVKINVASFAYEYTSGRKLVDAEGRTVRECLTHLVAQYPAIGEALFAEKGKLREYLEIYVNREISYREGLDKPVKDGDELYIVRNMSGG